MFEYTKAKLNKLEVGYQFDELNGHPICNKYFTPQTLNAMKSGQKKRPKENAMFARHIDTSQFKRNTNAIPPGAVVYISEKVHGTCVPYNARIRMADGSASKISKIKIGDSVLGINTDGALCPAKVLHVWNHGEAESGWVRLSGRRIGLWRGNSTFNLVCTPKMICF
jgi:hypothetical protein